MPRFFPPHLMALVVVLIVVVWIMLVHHFRHNTTVQRFVAETFGDDTPEKLCRLLRRRESVWKIT
jgi:hypothetical protein